MDVGIRTAVEAGKAAADRAEAQKFKPAVGVFASAYTPAGYSWDQRRAFEAAFNVQQISFLLENGKAAPDYLRSLLKQWNHHLEKYTRGATITWNTGRTT